MFADIGGLFLGTYDYLDTFIFSICTSGYGIDSLELPFENISCGFVSSPLVSKRSYTAGHPD